MFRDYMIQTIRSHQYYEDGKLESMSDEELRDIYECLINWIG